MAQQYQVQYIDDLDGTPLGNEAETIEFSVGGRDYSIDLSDENAAAFREALAPYVENASRVTGGRKKGMRKSRGSSVDTRAVRVWAQGNGYEVSDRGRIPSTILEAYAAAN